MNIRRTLLAAVAVTTLMAGAGLAGAQTSVTVTGIVGPSSRTLAVQDLVGQPLTRLDFETGGSLPFQVKVVDDNFSNDAFTVEATMTNLYVDNLGTLDLTKKIASSNIEVGTLVNPLGVADVVALVDPTFDTVVKVADAVVCGTLGLVFDAGLGYCQLAVNDVAGLRQTIAYASGDIVDLTKLPIVPQAPATGAFTDPDYTAEMLGDKPSGANPATPKRMLGGTAIDATGVTKLTALLDTQLGTLTDRSEAQRDALIDADVFAAAVQNAVSVVLSTADLELIVSSVTTLTRDAVGLVSQAGAYRSFPVLSLAIPAGAAAGDYRGTLIVTEIQ